MTNRGICEAGKLADSFDKASKKRLRARCGAGKLNLPNASKRNQAMPKTPTLPPAYLAGLVKQIEQSRGVTLAPEKGARHATR